MSRHSVGKQNHFPDDRLKFSDAGEQGNQDDGPGLDDIALMMKYDHQRVFELKGDEQ